MVFMPELIAGLVWVAGAVTFLVLAAGKSSRDA